MVSILILAWNSQHFIEATRGIDERVKVDVVSVQEVNRTNSFPDPSKYDVAVINQMGRGDWEEEFAKRAKFLVAFKSSVDSLSSVSREEYEILSRYLAYDGLENLRNFVLRIASYFEDVKAEDPKPLPWNGIYHPEGGFFPDLESYLNWYGEREDLVGILFYRGRYVYRNTEHIDLLIEEIEKRGLGVIPVFTMTFPDESVGMPGVDEAISKYFFSEEPVISALVWALYFRVCWDMELLERLDVPVINAIEIYANSPEEWERSEKGLNPVTLSMAVALPEFNGVINPTVLSGEIRTAEILKAVPVKERVGRIAEQVVRWVRLRRKKNFEKRVAIVLHQSDIGNVEANLGTALGLDTFESVREILRAMKERGYDVVVPERVEVCGWRSEWNPDPECAVRVIPDPDKLPERVRREITETWGDPEEVCIPGRWYGKVFVTVQPMRADIKNPEEYHRLIHDPTLPVPHRYYAFYDFIVENFDAVVHVGKHGSVEWLPGKSVALSENCYPDVCLKSIPNVYIYIVNNPAEGTQAKRRGYSTIVDHLPPPMRRSRRYEDLETALEEYFRAEERGLRGQMEVARRRVEELAKKYRFEFKDLRELHAKIEEQNSSLFNVGLHVFGRLRNVDEFAGIIAEKCGVSFEEAKRRLEGIREMENLLRALEGRFVPPSASGDVTRGRIEAIPTGFNFYSVDPRAIPTKTAWDVGKRLAEQLLEKMLEEDGRYPETVAFVEWSSDPMNTDGEQIAEILYLLGVKPVWEGGRVVGLEVIPLEELGRPRVDVIVRISGLFRDTFMNLVELIDEAVTKVAKLEEPTEMNFVRKHFLEGLRHRVFGDKPGSYGAGVNHAINSSMWEKEEELAEIYVRWGCYAYGKDCFGVEAREEFLKGLKEVSAVVRNHYTDEWDVLDDDCPYAFQGGLALTVKTVTGRMPKVLIGDTRDPERCKIVDAGEEVERVVRKTLLNEEWVEGMMRHGYKGAGDMMKKVVNLFGWQATADAVEEWMFDEIAERFVLDDGMREWFLKNNPHAIEEIARRLLEANRRGYWDSENVEKIEEIYSELEGVLEDEM